MDPLGATQLQGVGPTGAIPPYQYGPPETGGQDQYPPRRRRRPIWPWIAAVVALVVIGAVVLAYEAINGHSTPPRSEVPSVVGKKLADAEATLTKDGFKPVAQPKVTNGKPNIVLSTNPAGGQFVTKGSKVTVVYSARPGSKAIPSVKGMTFDDAENTLHAAGFTVVTKSSTAVASLTIPDGSVVSSLPAAGTKVPLSTQIVLRVSGGGVSVPTVTDEQLSDAETAIRAAHLVPNVINAQGPPGAAPGSVWQESPNAQKVVLPGSTVNLYVVPGSPTPTATPTTPSSSPSSSGSPSSSPSPSPSSPSPSQPGQ